MIDALDMHDRIQVTYQFDTRRHTFAAIGLLAVLNAADIVLTRMILAHTGVRAEANPVARLLLVDFRVEMAKVLILVALGVRVVRSRASNLNVLCLAWGVVGFYVMTVAVNAMILASL